MGNDVLRNFIRLFFILTLTLPVFSEEWFFESLIKRGELLYSPNDMKPYTGKVFDLYPNGEKKLLGEVTDGKRSGKWTYYRESDNTITYHLRYHYWSPEGGYTYEPVNDKGDTHGIEVKYSKDGNKIQETTYVDGIPKGRVEGWYNSGNRKFIGQRDWNNRQGKWTYWDENGKKVKEEFYSDDGGFEPIKIVQF